MQIDLQLFAVVVGWKVAEAGQDQRDHGQDEDRRQIDLSPAVRLRAAYLKSIQGIQCNW